MAITPDQARAELARRELARRNGNSPPSGDAGSTPGQDIVEGVKSPWSVGLKLPEKYAKSGLNQLANLVPKPEPTGNRLLDIAKGTPRIAAESLAETAPSFVNRGSLVTMGIAPALKAVRPLASMARSGLMGQAEEMAMGAKGKGALEAAYNDASTIFSRGKEAAKPMYQAAKSAAGEGANLFKGNIKNGDIIEKALEYINNGGRLEPTEAHTVRKSIDAVYGSKTYSVEALDEFRKIVDGMAKASPDIAKADPLFRKGVQGAALRKVLPQNLRGGTSPFKMAIGTALTEMGPLGKVASLGLSPLGLGAAATSLGVLERQAITPILNSPKLAAATYAILKRRFESPGAK